MCIPCISVTTPKHYTWINGPFPSWLCLSKLKKIKCDTCHLHTCLNPSLLRIHYQMAKPKLPTLAGIFEDTRVIIRTLCLLELREMYLWSEKFIFLILVYILEIDVRGSRCPNYEKYNKYVIATPQQNIMG